MKMVNQSIPASLDLLTGTPSFKQMICEQTGDRHSYYLRSVLLPWHLGMLT